MISPLVRLSHISLQVSNAQKVIRDLVTKYRFHPFASCGLDGRSWCQVALRNGGVIFMVNENPGDTAESSSLLYDYPISQPYPDTACNVSYEVEDVPSLCQHLAGNGCQLLVPPTKLSDIFGSVMYCVVKSAIRNVSHTLIDRTQYGASFLPGFQHLENKSKHFSSEDMTHIDHVTYVLPRGDTPRVLEWYQRCLGFQHFPLNKGEDPLYGFEITGPQIGLRMTSVESPTLKDRSKAVFCESLPQEGINQVDQFLKHHEGGGIQHVGLSTSNIFKSARAMAESGVQFASQPYTYYTNSRKQLEIHSAGLEPELLSEFGILLDTSAVGTAGTSGGFLLQVFAEPLFSKDSFYLELVERRGASGFGEGNIRALWQSMQECLKEKEQVETAAPTAVGLLADGQVAVR
ncbi:4-hydroxyphenylpyruvate dioxygenase-like protein isoform X2 [Bombina bombina]|nr:4-hydroxyphenylpyruvate dioxygenase-like protein isoform X2 [Bombina bombina]XP_053549540.1 4-hydroxyphenylpyruvate dioxygenase-like protein isoform X2 [Bombina bombina]XP_053549541.1 4-hydroxyphenylpyruvate dioxygenase-like protein isoform X2 [Bombina bombina]XP_053549542.1 4-hydroxyphenylpyruvate dioxygenase-like protein isoform X2 [Bombina bombina]